MSVNKLKLSLLAILPILAGCASQQGIQVRVMRPAPVNLSQYEVVAIDQFDGKGCAELSDQFTLALRKARNPLTGKADFKVVDRQEVDQMLDSLRGRRGKQWDDEALAVLEEWRSADVYIKGEILAQDVDESLTEDEWTDREGNLHVTLTRQCLANISVTIEATDTEGDQVFDRVTFQGHASKSTNAVNEEPAGIDEEDLLFAARNQVVQRYLKRIMPYEEYVVVNLYKDGDFPGLQIGNGYAQTGAWDQALESYRGSLELMQGEKAAYRYKALFNMGVALEYSNQFEAARQALRDAYALQQEGNILREIQNVDRREEEYHALQEQGQKIAAPGR
ncbi:MAG: hypothetical protein ACYTG5_03855 [Planctomycetota bacterium]|jgi:tetratricopeptide (TPR) repeat protein